MTERINSSDQEKAISVNFSISVSKKTKRRFIGALKAILGFGSFFIGQKVIEHGGDTEGLAAIPYMFGSLLSFNGIFEYLSGKKYTVFPQEIKEEE